MYTTNETEPTNIKITPNMNASSSTNGQNGNGMGGGSVVVVGSALNGNNAINGNGNGAGYKNGGMARRDSAQVLTPLLPHDANSQSNNEQQVAAALGIKDNVENNSQTNNNTASNNNEWKDNEEINNLKNELLHHQGNNNGSLINGKNGLDKYNEQDPLTGLYNGQNGGASHAHESDEFDFDDQHEEDASKTPSCGIFGCRPKWARKLASTHVFMVVFLLAYILQGMYMTYFVSVITTIEKLFQIKSKTTGFLLSASEMGQISTALLLTYFAGRGHRPRWIACGMVVFSLAAFSCSLPHFIFGEQLMHASMLSNGVSVPVPVPVAKDVSILQMNQTHSHAESSFVWGTDKNLCLATNASANSASECNEDRKLEQASQSKITSIVLCIFFVSLLSTGIGQTAVATLGIPYIDDNVGSKQSPMYMAITIGVRILGPASGFIVGSLCSRIFVDLSNPGFNAGDPRWIGAWWLGPVMIGSLMMLASIAMFSFPKQLHGKRTSTTNGSDNKPAAIAEVDETPKLRDFPKTVRRQLSNDILMFRTASCVFHLLPIAGLYTFLPKYLETQFRLATYDANMITANCGILVMGVGIVVSGLVIFKLKPSARSVAAWIAFTALFYSAGMLILMFVGCNNDDFAGYKISRGNTPAVIEPACSAALNCTCDRENFAPICGVDGRMYLSSCHAGCSMSAIRASDNKTVYANCACIPDPINNDGVIIEHEAVSGYCDTDCKNFIIFVLIFASCVFMHSTSEVGSMLLVMRCTHPKDKAMAMGVIQSAIGLFGNVPCPIIYGAVVDSACLIWKTVCGKHGACSLYDSASFRHYFLGMTTGIMFLAFIMDLVVWSKAHRIDIAPEDNANAAEDNDQATVTASEYKKSLNDNSANGTPDTSV